MIKRWTDIRIKFSSFDSEPQDVKNNDYDGNDRLPVCDSKSIKRNGELMVLSCILRSALSKPLLTPIIVGVVLRVECLHTVRGCDETNDGLPAVVCVTVYVERKKRMRNTQKNTHTQANNRQECARGSRETLAAWYSAQTTSVNSSPRLSKSLINNDTVRPLAIGNASLYVLDLCPSSSRMTHSLFRDCLPICSQIHLTFENISSI